MRKVIAERSWLGSVDIGAIELDAESRDDIPALLIGLQAIFEDEATREKLFRLLEAHILPGHRRDTGRPGMDLWRILAVGLLKQGLRCDFDRLREIVNRHADVQSFLGHDVWFDPCRYKLQTIRDNVALLTPELLGKVNDLVAAAGQEILGLEPGAALVGRCDSFVVETDVHYPTDVGLLRDSVRCLLREASRACAAFGVSGWRQRRHWERAVGSLFNAVRTASLQRSRPGAVRSYLAASLKLAAKAEGSLAALKRAGCPEPVLDEIGRLVAHARRFADQIDRRVLRGEKIPHEEKLFSIFEGHTRWISKGKAGKKVEFGVPVCIVEDGNGFALGHEILWTGGDADVAVPLIKRCREAFPNLRGCSFDRGFHSPSNREELDKLLELNALPKKGKLSAAEREREAEPAFAAARRKHSGVESAINSLEHRGLDRVRLRGPDGFELAVGLSVLAFNVHRIGQILRERERKQMQLQRKRMQLERERGREERRRAQLERRRMRRECEQRLQPIRRQRAA